MKYKSKLDNPYLLMGILLFFWGSFAAVSKLTLGKLDSFQVQFYIFGFAALIMTSILFAAGKHKDMKYISAIDYARLFVFGLTQFLYYFLYVISLSMIPAIEASAINYLFPIFVVLFAIPIHGEKLNIYKIISLLIGFMGVLIIITGGNISSFKLTNIYGDLMAFAAAISFGLFSNLGKLNKLDPFISNYIYTVTAFVLSLIGLLCFSRFTIPDASSLGGTLWLSLTNIILTYYIWFRVLKIATPSLAANLSFFTPFITLTFIVILTGEKIIYSQLIGLVIIILGTAVQNEHLISRLNKIFKCLYKDKTETM